MKVLKFGGSVLKNINDIQIIQEIVSKKITNNNKDKIIIVLSAFYKITDKLLEIFSLLLNNKDCTKELKYIQDFHINLINNVCYNENSKKDILSLINELNKTINKIKLKVCSNNVKNIEKDKDLLISFGERLSSKIIFHYLSKQQPISYVSSQELIKTDSNFGNAKVDLITTKTNIIEFINSIESKVIVCAGFIGSNNKKQITTLGRNGTDYSASLYANSLQADVLEIWKDIDGLYTADPKIVDNVKFIKQITYQEMAELSSLGNQVIHIDAITNCKDNNIPIIIKNCYNINSQGTIISNKKCENYYVNSIVKMDNIFLVKLMPSELIDITELSIKLQHILKNYNNIIITISQNIKQRVISLLLIEDDKTNKLLNIIKTKFKKDKNCLNIEISNKVSMITVLGADFSNVIGLAGKIFNILQYNNINVKAIHDDFSDTRISFICDDKDANNIVKLLHRDLVK